MPRGPKSTERDLFSVTAESKLAENGPLAARMRPRTFDEVVGQKHLVAHGAPFRRLVEADRLTSAILWGPPGTGKTTLALLVAASTSKTFVPMSAVTAGVAEVRQVIVDARRRLGEIGNGTIVFLDEVHRFSRSQQDALLPSVEEGLIVLIGATTENPFFSINAPLLSRSTLWQLNPLQPADLTELVTRVADDVGASLDDEAVQILIGLADGDARAALGTLEVAAALAKAETPGLTPGSSGLTSASPSQPSTAARPLITGPLVHQARGGRLHHRSDDTHYDQVSALIKSIRGSDVDAGLYWLSRLLAAGEDPRFTARRLVILASEDVGMADPTGLGVAVAAARAVELVGLPEAELNLAQAVVHLATAPKSNSVTVALRRAKASVESGRHLDVPIHLRDAHSSGARSLGHGEHYHCPHEDERGWVEQDYLPAGLEDHVFYEPSEHGDEARLRGSANPERLSAEPPRQPRWREVPASRHSESTAIADDRRTVR